MISRVRKIPVGQNPEDVMRDLAGDREVAWKNHDDVMQYLYDTLEQHPDIGGIIGYSEGASIAATFILDEQRRFEETGRERRTKCAIFITGWPPIDPNKGIILADQDDDLIDVPTLHVVGANGMIHSRTPVASVYSRFYQKIMTDLISSMFHRSRSLPTWRIRAIQRL
jgi:ferric iron reductase protein FhuF